MRSVLYLALISTKYLASRGARAQKQKQKPPETRKNGGWLGLLRLLKCLILSSILVLSQKMKAHVKARIKIQARAVAPSLIQLPPESREVELALC